MSSRLLREFFLYIIYIVTEYVVVDILYGFGLLVVVTVLVSSTVTTDNVPLENN